MSGIILIAGDTAMIKTDKNTALTRLFGYYVKDK